METEKLIDEAVRAAGGYPLLVDRIAYKERTLKRVRAGEIELSSKLRGALERVVRDAAMAAPRPRTYASLQETIPVVSNVEPVKAKSRQIPIFTFVPGGPPVDFEVLPADWQDTISYDGKDPNAFALRLTGDSMAPKFTEGMILTVSPATKAGNGDHVIATIKNEGSIFKRLYVSGDHKTITLTSYNNASYPPIVRPREDFHEIFKVVFVTQQL